MSAAGTKRNKSIAALCQLLDPKRTFWLCFGERGMCNVCGRRDGVETLTKKDIEGLSLEQIKQLRGY
jgi:hypothetical protein